MIFSTRMHRLLLVLGFGLLVSAYSIAQNQDDDSEIVASDNWPGQFVDAFGSRVVDVFGQVHRPGISKKVSPFVVIFIDRDCPVSARYAADLNELQELATAAGLDFYGILSNPLMSAVEARQYVDDAEFNFPVLWDPSGDLTLRFEPAVTPEVFVVSPDSSVIYRGRIDNRFPSLGVLRNEITSHDLKDVISALSKGENLTPRYQPSIGCIFQSWSDELPEQVTYTRDIAPIVNANCVECHRDEGVAPFSLETYDAVKFRAPMIAHVTAEGLMPPWRARKGYGEFRDERFLSQRQIGLLAAWAKADSPKGDEDQQVPDPVWPSPKWQLGEPDLVIEMEQDFEIPAGGPDIYRYFVIPVELLKDQMVVAAEFRPGNPKVVHHSLVYIDYSGRASKADAKDESYGFSMFGTGGGFFNYSSAEETQYVYGWAPGLDPLNLPPDHGIPITGKPGDAVFEIHYRPNGIATTDRSRMGLYFADKPVSKIAASFVLGTLDINIAPNDDDYWRHVYADIPADIRIIAVSPHMHYLGREVKAVATVPDGSEIPLLHIPNWDFRWQNLYIYREPLELPAGSHIDVWLKFDNSSSNPYNPHTPPVPISWGWSSDQEMGELWMRFVTDDDDDRLKVIRAGEQNWSRKANVLKPPPEWPIVE